MANPFEVGIKTDLRTYVADLRRGMRQSRGEKNIIIRKNIFILVRKLFKPSDDERSFQEIFSKKPAQLERPSVRSLTISSRCSRCFSNSASVCLRSVMSRTMDRTNPSPLPVSRDVLTSTGIRVLSRCMSMVSKGA